MPKSDPAEPPEHSPPTQPDHAPEEENHHRLEISFLPEPAEDSAKQTHEEKSSRRSDPDREKRILCNESLRRFENLFRSRTRGFDRVFLGDSSLGRHRVHIGGNERMFLHNSQLAIMYRRKQEPVSRVTNELLHRRVRRLRQHTPIQKEAPTGKCRHPSLRVNRTFLHEHSPGNVAQKARMLGQEIFFKELLPMEARNPKADYVTSLARTKQGQTPRQTLLSDSEFARVACATDRHPV